MTDFELTTAQQLCLERNRDTPNAQDLQDAVKLCAGWNIPACVYERFCVYPISVTKLV